LAVLQTGKAKDLSAPLRTKFCLSWWLVAALSTMLLVNSSVNEGGSNQNLMLFIRGNVISGAPSISGTNQFPNPQIMIGITMKNTITKAYAVTITL
jgi:hypothetical protein